MAVGTYTLPICDGCKLPWLPVGWSQDSDPRNLPSGAKPLRCGKCKTSGWDREHNAEMRHRGEAQLDAQRSPKPSDAGSTPVSPANLHDGIPFDAEVPPHVYPEYGGISRKRLPVNLVGRCIHRMTNCPICNPTEDA